jgi:hypothetical protein
MAWLLPDVRSAAALGLAAFLLPPVRRALRRVPEREPTLESAASMLLSAAATTFMRWTVLRPRRGTGIRKAARLVGR